MGLIHTLPGRVQIAGVIDQEEADLIIKAGADMLGFPLGLEDGREDLEVDEAAAIIGNLSESATGVCITYLKTSDDVVDLCSALHAPWVQLHGAIESIEVAQLRALRPDLGIIKSLIVRPDTENETLAEISLFEPHVDAFITDTFDPETGRSGATGKTHDWRISQQIVEATTRPVILAGGLTTCNVAAAIEQVRPAAVDAHTGVEGLDGRKDPAVLGLFVQEARQAFGYLSL